MVEAVSATATPDLHQEGNNLAPSNLLSDDLIIGLIGYAGAGCTDVYKRLNNFLKKHGFETHRVKLSDGIANYSKVSIPDASSTDGDDKLARAEQLQDLGDKLRADFSGEAVASLAVREIKELRLTKSKNRKAIIVDSLKHPAEVELLRIVYENSFLLLGVYCGKETRLTRLQEKFYGVPIEQIKNFMKRDERDPDSILGQQVRKAFHQADFFLDNGINAKGGHARNYDTDLNRFVEIMEGGSLIRPNAAETAMYSAYSAAHRSSCLSRQVGAAITNEKGDLIATGVNEVPAFDGGVYHDGHAGEGNRCFKWAWWNKLEGDIPLAQQQPCCHNTRKKNELKVSIAKWMGENISSLFSNSKYPVPANDEMDLHEVERNTLRDDLSQFFNKFDEKEHDGNILLDGMPGIGDLIEYSRSIHAEMDAVLTAARGGAKLHGILRSRQNPKIFG